jgi:hypothetical protein
VLTEKVTLTNTGQSPANYIWESTKTVFIVSPQEVPHCLLLRNKILVIVQGMLRERVAYRVSFRQAKPLRRRSPSVPNPSPRFLSPSSRALFVLIRSLCIPFIADNDRNRTRKR